MPFVIHRASGRPLGRKRSQLLSLYLHNCTPVAATADADPASESIFAPGTQTTIPLSAHATSTALLASNLQVPRCAARSALSRCALSTNAPRHVLASWGFLADAVSHACRKA
jgi:hypothetical protein